jgi:hypothetical protein
MPQLQTVRLYFKSYIKAIQNSVGTNLFRNLYVRTDEKGEFDALDDGADSCAFFVSAVLVIFKRITGIHGTVEGTIKDLRESGWIEVTETQAGDIIVWEAQKFENSMQEHIGFSIGNNRAISTSWTKKTPVEHDQTFGSTRKITQIFRMPNWDH